jgi:hypothetical protein
VLGGRARMPTSSASWTSRGTSYSSTAGPRMETHGGERVLPAEDGLMPSIERAAELARRFLTEEVGTPDFPFALIEEQHARVGRNIFFDCQSAAYPRSGDPSDMAVGTGCVRVDGETGACRLLGAVESVEPGTCDRPHQDHPGEAGVHGASGTSPVSGAAPPCPSGRGRTCHGTPAFGSAPWWVVRISAHVPPPCPHRGRSPSVPASRRPDDRLRRGLRWGGR